MPSEGRQEREGFSNIGQRNKKPALEDGFEKPVLLRLGYFEACLVARHTGVVTDAPERSSEDTGSKIHFSTLSTPRTLFD